MIDLLLMSEAGYCLSREINEFFSFKYVSDFAAADGLYYHSVSVSIVLVYFLIYVLQLLFLS